MSPEQLADLAEAAALRRYLAMRALWAPCWGRSAQVRRAGAARGARRRR